MEAKKILEAVTSVIKNYTKRKKQELRSNRGPRAYYYSDRVTHTDVADSILPEAYNHASNEGQYTASRRQVYYASREAFLKATGKPIEYKYFDQLLANYMDENNLSKVWKITADPRGTFEIPNTSSEKRIPVGTLAIDAYLDEKEGDIMVAPPHLPIQFPSTKSGVRYQAILYIEKEGFGPMLKEAGIAEKFDVAILSCKGQSVVAARRLVDMLCSVEGGIPLFVVHDFDIYGFQIRDRLAEVAESGTIRYRFENKINMTDFGLRLEDALAYGLASETVELKRKLAIPAGLTKDEIEFLQSGKRVELNAFTTSQFIEWLEGKLRLHLPERLIPDDDVLELAWRRAVQVATLNNLLDEQFDIAMEAGELTDVPDDLRKLVIEKVNDETPWDVALHQIAQQDLNNE